MINLRTKSRPDQSRIIIISYANGQARIVLRRGSERFVVDGKVEVNAGCAVGPHGLAPVIDRPGFFYDHKLVAAGVAHVQSVHDPLAEVQFRVVAVGIAAYVGVFKAIRNRVETGQRICARPVNAQLNSRDKHLAILKDQARTAFEGAGVDSFEIDCGDIKGAMHPFAAPLQGVEIVGGIHVGAAGSVRGVRFGSKHSAGERGIVVEFDAKLDVARIVAREAEVMIGDTEIHVRTIGANGPAQITGRADAILVSNGLVAVIEHDQV